MGHHLRSQLVRLFPDMQQQIQIKQSKQAAYHNNSKPLRSFSVGDPVYTKDLSTIPTTWTPGVIIRATGSLLYHVELQCGRVARHHVDTIHRLIFTTHIYHITFHTYRTPLHSSKTCTFLPELGRMTFLQCLTVRNPLLPGDRLVPLTVMVLRQRLDSPCEILEGGSVACIPYCTLNCLWVAINCACMPNSMVFLPVYVLVCFLCHL